MKKCLEDASLTASVLFKRINFQSKVAIDPNRPCRSCDPCLAGRTHFCLTEGPRRAYGVQQNGGCAEFIVVPKDVVYLVHRLPSKEAVLVEPVSCIIRGMDNLGEIDKNGRVLIQGAGIIGLLWLCILHHEGCRDLTISDVAEGRRKLAADLKLAPSVRVVDAADLEGIVEAFDVVVDCSGNSGAIENALELLRRGGKLSIFSCCPTDAKVTFSPFELYRKELTIVSSFINPLTFERAIDLVTRLNESGYLELDKLGVGLFCLADVHAALADLSRGKISKAVFAL